MLVVEADPRSILAALVDHGVDFVVIGASAAIMQGVPLAPTLDVDITARKSQRNLKRLAAALSELDARLRIPGDDVGVATPLDARMLANLSTVTLVTRHGPFDILFAPPGAEDYELLRKRSIEVRPYGVAVGVARVEDLIAMKKVAGREKDAAHLTVLLDHLKETRSRG